MDFLKWDTAHEMQFFLILKHDGVFLGEKDKAGVWCMDELWILILLIDMANTAHL